MVSNRHMGDMNAYWCITDSCNIECKYCFRPRFSKEINIDIIRSAIDGFQRNNVSKVTITGGEPFTCQYLYSCLTSLNEIGVESSIITNGMYHKRLLGYFQEGLLASASISMHGDISRINSISKMLKDYAITFLLPLEPIDFYDKYRKIEHLSISEGHIVSPMLIEQPNGQLRIEDESLLDLISTTLNQNKCFSISSNTLAKQLSYFKIKSLNMSDCCFYKNTLFVTPNGLVVRCFYRTNEILGKIYEDITSKVFSLKPCKVVSSGCVCVNVSEDSI